MAISKKIEESITQSSWIRKMFEDGVRLKSIHGAENVFDFSLGNPNIEPPSQFKDLLRKIVNEDVPGMHSYMPNAGYMATRSALADYIGAQNGINISGDNIIMTCGAGGALNVIFKTLLDPGDEVVVFAPFFVEYRFYVENHGGLISIVPTKEDFSLDIEKIREAVTRQTKIVLINSPNNPTGAVYDEDSIRELTQLLEEKSRQYGKDIYLVSDEPYRDIVYDGVKVVSILKAYKNSIVASSYSKTLSIPGERIGYIAVSPDIADSEQTMNGMIISNRILGFTNAPALMQRIVADLQGVFVDVQEYRRKRDMLCEGLQSIGYRFEVPRGAFYLFPRTPVEDEIEFVKALQKHNILTVPGRAFGKPGHIRIAYCVDDRTIVNAMKGFRDVMEHYRQGF